MRTTKAPVALGLSFALSLALLLLGTAHSRAQNQPAGATARMTPPAELPPANYRQLIAAYVSTDHRYTVRDAKITKPYERWGGLLKGGTVTVVCVAVFRDNPFGIVVRDNWVFRFESGAIKPTGLGMDQCSDLAPFPELLAAIAARRPGGGAR